VIVNFVVTTKIEIK